MEGLREENTLLRSARTGVPPRVLQSGAPKREGVLGYELSMLFAYAKSKRADLDALRRRAAKKLKIGNWAGRNRRVRFALILAWFIDSEHSGKALKGAAW
jgi:hypothetical protein